MAKPTVDMWGPFKSVALVFLGGGLVASLGSGLIAPFAICALAVGVLVKVFRALEG